MKHNLISLYQLINIFKFWIPNPNLLNWIIIQKKKSLIIIRAENTIRSKYLKQENKINNFFLFELIKNFYIFYI